MKVEPASIVIKKSGADKGEIGIVLKYEVNSLHNEIVTIMTPRGTIKVWYAKLIKEI